MKVKRILYLGWLGHGNVGDDLLYIIFQELIIKEALKNNIGLVISVVQEEYSFSILNYDLVVLGGGSLLSLPLYLDICLKAKALKIPVIVWGSGFDLREGAYVDPVLYSFFNNRDSGEINGVIKDYNKIKLIVEYASIAGVRGNITKYLINDNKVKVIGDPGILLNQFGYKYRADNEIDKFVGESENVILVNWGTSNNYILGGNEKRVFEALKEVIQILLVKKYKIILYPIWIQDIAPCRYLAGMFKDCNLHVVNKVYDVFGIAYMIKKSKFSINFKLHANIMSMALQKPFLSLAYGLKCYDFAQTVHALDLVVPTDRVSVNEVIEKINYIERNYKNIQSVFIKEISGYNEIHVTFIQEAVSILKKYSLDV